MRLGTAVLVSAVLTLVFTPGSALAKGEGGGLSGFCFGQDQLTASAVRFPEDLPDRVFVSTNFGLLQSDDGGQTYGWICPRVYGTQIAGNFLLFLLPGMTTLPDGTAFILPGTLGYWVSGEDSCRFDAAPDDDLRSATVVSIASRPSLPDVVLAGLSWPGREPYGIFRSDDGGADFVATDFVSDGRIRFGSVHLTPGGERAYVSTRNDQGFVSVWHSEDGSTDWIAGAFEREAQGAAIVGSRVDAPDELYLGTTDAVTGACDLTMSVLKSEDAGDSFDVVETRDEILVGVVVEDDGTVWLGWKDSGIVAWRDGVVEPLEGSPAPIGCLAAAPGGGLAVCPLDDSDVLVSVRPAEGGDFAPLVTLDRITGPLDCADDTPVGRECTDAWLEMASFWGLETGGEDPDAGPGAPDGGAPGEDAGTIGDDDDDDVIGGGDDDDDGCSCRAAGAHRVGPAAPVLLAGLVSFVVRARRRRR